MKNLLVATLAILVPVLVFTFSAAEGPPESGGDLREETLRTVLRLRLTEKQKQEVAGILAENRPQMRQADKSLQGAMPHLLETLTSKGSDAGAIQAAFKPVTQAAEEMAVLFGKQWAQLEAILSPEQRQIVQEKAKSIIAKAKKPPPPPPTMVDEWIEVYK
jgi:Spy/CpxP family protein refolding chaperone